MIIVAALVSLAAFALTWAGAALLRRWAPRLGLLDIPNERSSHTVPTPRGGGLAIVVATILGLWLVYAVLKPGELAVALLIYTLGAAQIAVVSWANDRRSLSATVRLASHALGAALGIFAFGYWHTVSLPLLGLVSLGWLGGFITLLWIVGLTNAYNFMDGIDGLAGGQAVIAGLGWAVLGGLSRQPLVSAFGLLLAASSLGFLAHNWPPARIFMGDVGSAFLGYTFAVVAVMAAAADTRLALAGVLLLWPFVFDTALTFLCRLLKGENVFAAHRSHLYQRLILAGHSHRAVTLLYLGLALIGAALAVGWLRR